MTMIFLIVTMTAFLFNTQGLHQKVSIEPVLTKSQKKIILAKKNYLVTARQQPSGHNCVIFHKQNFFLI